MEGQDHFSHTEGMAWSDLNIGPRDLFFPEADQWVAAASSANLLLLSVDCSRLTALG